MKTIYNEGRVVGLSGWEIYTRHFLQEFPDKEIMTEREWLAATIGNGQSMILKVVKGTKAGVHDFTLPKNSYLCAANTVVASMFNGECTCNGNWATSVSSYGPLILNDNSKSPSSPGRSGDAPYDSEYGDWITAYGDITTEYLKIVDGVVVQPGNWKETGTSKPKKVLSPEWGINNQSNLGFLRLRITKDLNRDVYILLTGFMYAPIISGLSKLDSGAYNTEHPENGDFLGSEVFPWGCKIIFSVPSEAYSILTNSAYERQLPKGTDSEYVDSKPIIDYVADRPEAYYENEGKEYKSSGVTQNVNQFHKVEEDASIIASYRRDDAKHTRNKKTYSGKNYPPVLYGSVVDKTGDDILYPLDTAAPGTIKMFEDKDLAMSYPHVIPGVYSQYMNDEGDIFVIDKETTDEDLVPITTKVKVVNKGTSTRPQYIETVRARDDRTDKIVEREVWGVSMRDTSDNELSTSGSKSTSRTDKTTTDSDQNNWVDATKGLSWELLLNSLGLDQKMEILGTLLRNFRGNLPNIVSGSDGILDIKGTGQSKIAGSLKIGDSATIKNKVTADGSKNETQFNQPVQSGANYITFSNGLRLYIAKKAPTDTDIPVGSIGIGWGMTDK